MMLPTTSTLTTLIDEAICTDKALLLALHAIYGPGRIISSDGAADRHSKEKFRLSTRGLSPNGHGSYIITPCDTFNFDESDDSDSDETMNRNESGLRLHIWLSIESTPDPDEVRQDVATLKDDDFDTIWQTLYEASVANLNLLKAIEEVECYRSTLKAGAATADLLAVDELLTERGLLPDSERALTIINDDLAEHQDLQPRLHVYIDRPQQLTCVAAQTWTPCGTTRAPWSPPVED